MATGLENHVPLNVENRARLSNYSLDPRNALYLHHSNNPNCSSTNEPLTRGNYAQWKRSCEVLLSAKNKMTFVTREHTKPPSNSPIFLFGKDVIIWLFPSCCILLTKTLLLVSFTLPQQLKFSKICHRV